MPPKQFIFAVYEKRASKMLINDFSTLNTSLLCGTSKFVANILTFFSLTTWSSTYKSFFSRRQCTNLLKRYTIVLKFHAADVHPYACVLDVLCLVYFIRFFPFHSFFAVDVGFCRFFHSLLKLSSAVIFVYLLMSYSYVFDCYQITEKNRRLLIRSWFLLI